MTALFAARPNTTCISSARTGSTGCGPIPLGASLPSPLASSPLRSSELPASNPLTYARSWHRPFAPCSRSPIRTQSPAHTTFGTDVSSGGRDSNDPGENHVTAPGHRTTCASSARAPANPGTAAGNNSSKSSATISSSDRHATAPPL